MHFIFHLTFMNMRRRKARTILTLLGVTIGVVAVVSLLALGNGVKREMLAQFGDDASLRQIVVQAPEGTSNKKKLLTEHNMEKFAAIDHVARVYPRYEVFVTLDYDQYTMYSNLVGLPAEELKQLSLTDGSALNGSTQKPELILGNSMGYMLYNEKLGTSYQEMKGDLNALIGKKMQADVGFGEGAFSGSLKITGVLAGDADAFSESSQSIFCDMDVLIRYLKMHAGDNVPLGQEVDANGNPYSDWVYTSAVVVAEDMEDVEFIVKKLQDIGYQTTNEKEYLDSAKKTVRMMQLLLGGIGMISLLVAVIGISNTMMTAVYDRVDEIGLLKVLGCDIDELNLMYLFESGIFGFVGGVLGVLVSLLFQGIVNKVATSLLMLEQGVKLAVISPGLMGAAIFASTVLGLLAGYFPARWASRLNPLEAMRKAC